ncbi:MAG: hypothetical protein WCV88_04980 [Patescibacteria group bacterium]|jgi:hypothetical protein
MAKATILVIAPTPYFSDRGCHIRIYEELKVISNLGYQAELVTYPLGRSIGSAHITRTANLFWYKKTSAGPALSKIILDKLLILKALHITKKTHPVLIHAHLHEGMFIAWWVRFFYRIPILLDLQSNLSEELTSYRGIWKLLSPLGKIYENWCLTSADYVVASSNHFKKNITVLPDGISSTLPNLTGDYKYDLVYSGGLGKQKGTDLLFTILQSLDVKCLLIANDVTGYWHTQAEQLGIASKLTWLTVPYENLLNVLVTTKFGLEPKPIESTEGSGKLLNYMAAGVIPIALRKANPYIESLSDLDKILKQPVDLNYRKHMQDFVVKQSSWSNQTATLKQIYDRLIHQA